jgi:hypothetical protein
MGWTALCRKEQNEETMNSPKDTAADQPRADNKEERERTGTNVDRPEADRVSDTDEDPNAEPLLGSRHEGEAEGDGSSDLQGK